MTLTLVLGGARSGKSTVAESIAERLGPVTYLATIVPDPDDDDLVDRLDQHRRRRPAGWATVEPPYDLAQVLRAADGTVLLDSLGPWVALQQPGFDLASVIDALAGRRHHTVVVSEEVGLGVHPETEAGRRFRDDLGLVNQAVSDLADECLFVVAGRVLHLDRP